MGLSRHASASRTALDEVFVFRLKALHSILAPLMYDSLENRLATDKAFKQKYEEWVKKQGWTLDEERHSNIADQGAYILINKILFYKALERKKNLPPLTKKENVAELLEILRECFDAALKIDYKAVFQRDPIYDEIPLTPEVAQRLNILIDEVSEYDLSKMKRDVIGTLYEKLIPKEERRTLGQFYTPPQIVELIVKMCVRNPDDKVLDPGCGSGGFLVASYDHLLELKGKTETDEKTHQELLSQIWGVDINKFPAHLATINLANQNLESQSDHINVVISDFFDIREPEQKVLAPWSTVTLNDRREEVEIPLFDAVVANPPYTRHEEISSKQKKKIRAVALRYGTENIDLSARAGIYTYFFLHGAKFLKDDKRMGMIVSNSWLDVGFGGDLQKFFLDHFKILAIIDADKRVFRDADVNTVVVILEKADGDERKDERDANLVKFVRLKTHLEIDETIECIKKHNQYSSSENIRILPKRQRDLKEEGFDKEKHRYVGSKWGTYLRAPDIFYTILKKGASKLVRLQKMGKVRYPIKTGINEFFYANDEVIQNFGIEPEFLVPVIKSPKDFKTIRLGVDGLNKFLFRCNLSKRDLLKRDKKGALSYIEWGEKQVTKPRQKTQKGVPWPEVPSVQGRKPSWYSVEEIDPADVICNRFFDKRFFFGFCDTPAIEDQTFYGLILNEDYRQVKEAQIAILNTTLSYLLVEIFGRVALGQGVLQYATYEMGRLLTVDAKALPQDVRDRLVSAFKAVSTRQIHSIFEEVKMKDRRDLDNIIFDFVGLTEEERLEVYEAVRELVQRRITKAEEIGVLVGLEMEREKPWPLSSKELEELVTLLQLSKVGRLTEEQESTLGRCAGMVVRDLAYEIIRLSHEPMSVNEVAQRILDIRDEVLSLAGYYEVISEVMGGKATPKQVIRNLLSIWRDQPEGIEKTVSRLLSGDGRFLQIESRLFGLREWSPNELFQIYVQLVSKYRTTDYEKKETFKGEAIRLLESGEVDFPDKDGLIQTLRRL